MRIHLTEEVEYLSDVFQDEIALENESLFLTNKIYLELQNGEEKFVGMILSPLEENIYIERFLPCNNFFNLPLELQDFVKNEITKYFEKKFNKNNEYKIIKTNNDIIVKDCK